MDQPEHSDGRARAYPMVLCLELKPQGDRPWGKGVSRGLAETRAPGSGPWGRPSSGPEVRTPAWGLPRHRLFWVQIPCWRPNSPQHTCCPVRYLEAQPPVRGLGLRTRVMTQGTQERWAVHCLAPSAISSGHATAEARGAPARTSSGDRPLPSPGPQLPGLPSILTSRMV